MRPTPTRGHLSLYSISPDTAMAIDRQADVVLTSLAGMVASTKLQPIGLESQDNRLGSGTKRSSSCSTGLVKPKAPRKAANAWPGVCTSMGSWYSLSRIP